MIKIENIRVDGFEAALRGMRNPMNSWEKSDTIGIWVCLEPLLYGLPKIGDKDMELMQKLFEGGTEHRKYLRMIHVSMDISAPEYWWKQFSTYRVGVTENSTSTMHKITAKSLCIDDFSVEDMDPEEAADMVGQCEIRRLRYLRTKDKKDWKALIQGLPQSYIYKRTVDFNYEVVATMIRQRNGHKLSEWNDFIQVLIRLPYIREIMRGHCI